MLKVGKINTESENLNNLRVKIEVKDRLEVTPESQNIQKHDEHETFSDKTKKFDSEGSIFNAFFQQLSSDLWTVQPEKVSFEKLYEMIVGESYSKSWCFRISKNNKKEWFFIEFKGQYLIAYEDQTCKTPLTFFDTVFTKMEYIEIQVSDNGQVQNYYGQRIVKNGKFEEIFHPSRDFIEIIAENLAKHCVLSDFTNDFHVKESIGTGNFSEVFRCENKFTNEQYAVKVLEKKAIVNRNTFGQFLYEVTTLRNFNELKNNSCINLKFIYEGKQNMYLVTDICKGGNLFNHYVKNQANFTELDCLRVITSVLKGLAYLETKQIIHRDIKPANLVLKEENDIDNCVIVDFGQSVHSSDIEKNDRNIEYKVGTPGYIAPEILKGEVYDCNADVFSAGATLYLLSFERQLFYLNDKKECLDLNKQCPFNRTLKKSLQELNHDFDKGTIDLLRLMCEKDPKKRPYASQLLDHPIIKVAEQFTIKATAVEKKVKISSSSKANVADNVKKTSIFSKIRNVFTKKQNIGTKIEDKNSLRKANKTSSSGSKETMSSSESNEIVYINCSSRSNEERAGFVYPKKQKSFINKSPKMSDKSEQNCIDSWNVTCKHRNSSDNCIQQCM